MLCVRQCVSYCVTMCCWDFESTWHFVLTCDVLVSRSDESATTLAVTLCSGSLTAHRSGGVPSPQMWIIVAGIWCRVWVPPQRLNSDTTEADTVTLHCQVTDKWLTLSQSLTPRGRFSRITTDSVELPLGTLWVERLCILILGANVVVQNHSMNHSAALCRALVKLVIVRTFETWAWLHAQMSVIVVWFESCTMYGRKDSHVKWLKRLLSPGFLGVRCHL